MNDFFYNIFSALRGKNQFTQSNYTLRNNSVIGNRSSVVNCDTSAIFDLYDTTPQLSAVINRKAAMYSNGIWRHFKNGKEVENSPLTALLDNPNFIQNGVEFMKSDCINYSLFGNSVILSEKGAFSEAYKSLQVLPFNFLSFEKTGKFLNQKSLKNVITKLRLLLPNGVEYNNIDVDKILWLRNHNPIDPIVGMSLIPSLTMPISNIRASYGFRNRIITNNAALGILSSEAKDGLGISLDSHERQRITDGYTSQFGMQDGKLDIHMTEASVKWNPISYPTKDLLLFEEIDADFRIIIDAFGLNDNIFSREKSSTFSNLMEGIRLAYQDCIIPFAFERALKFSQFFGLNGKDEFLQIDYSHINILQQDLTTKASVDKTKAETYAILVNAGREDLAKLLY